MFRPLNPRSALSAAFLLLAVSGLAFSFGASPARADLSESILHTFGASSDGVYPSSVLVQTSDGSLWGTTEDGGTAGDGTIYKYTADGKYSVVHNFGDGSVRNDGAEPYDALTVGADGNLYGTTLDGGANSDGTVFQITPAGAVTILHSFMGNTGGDGSGPIASLTLGHDGKLYGSTFYGTDINDQDNVTPNDPVDGTLFSINTDGSGYVVQYRFYQSTTSTVGIVPRGILTPASGSSTVLYGTTSEGGAGNQGTVFAFTPGATDGSGTLKVLHSFDDGTTPNDGFQPLDGRLTLAPSGNLIGLTFGGGEYNGGVMYMLATDGSSYSILHAFGNGTDGTQPDDGLTLGSDGAYYGIAETGGASDAYGVVFRAMLTGSSIDYSVVYNFTAANGGGAGPLGKPYEDSDGNLVGGTMYTGDESGDGVLYKLLAGLPNPVDIASLALSPTTVSGGQSNSTGTITLNRPAGTSGAVIDLAVSQNAQSAASVPASITIAAGQETGTFTVTSHALASTVTGVISASYNNTAAHANLTINSPYPTPGTNGTLKALYLSPSSTEGGTSTTANRVFIHGTATADTLVQLSSSDPSVATVPSSFTLKENTSSHLFTITTKPVTSTTKVAISATEDGVTDTATLTVTP